MQLWVTLKPVLLTMHEFQAKRKGYIDSLSEVSGCSCVRRCLVQCFLGLLMGFIDMRRDLPFGQGVAEFHA